MNDHDNVVDPDEERAPTNDETSPNKQNYSIHNNNPRIQPISSSKTELLVRPNTATKKKKSVRFQDKYNKTALIHRLVDAPLASEMTTREKHRIWYNANEYDQFKYQAAKQAGVKIVRYDSDKADQTPHFVMMGDFDAKYEKKHDSGGSGSDNASSIVVCENSKCYYNENEYNDHTDSDGKVICKRGLGYNFSRSRKKSRIVTRSAVVAWQKTLRDQSSSSSSNNNYNVPSDLKLQQQQDDLPPTAITTVGKKNQLDKSLMMLALVSTKCSRIAREEARWRGDVDYRVAYPERHDDPIASRNNSGSIAIVHDTMMVCKGTDYGTNNDINNSIMVKNNKKRLACGGNNNVVVDTSTSTSIHMPSCKRQRRAGCYNQEELSPTTIGYLASGGVLQQAEV